MYVNPKLLSIANSNLSPLVAISLFAKSVSLFLFVDAFICIIF